MRLGKMVSLGCFLVVIAAPAMDDPIDLELARQYFEEARFVSEEDGGELWGIELHGPMLFVDPDTRFTVANRADAMDFLSPTESGDLFTGTLPETVGIANTKTRWAGIEWTMLMWPLPGHAGARRQLLAHEMFHRIQDDLDLGLGTPDNRHLDSQEGRVWMRLEWRALRQALGSVDDDRLQAIEDALVFRALRHATFAGRVKDELVLELNEGLAEYTGIRAGRTTEEEMFRQAIESLKRYDRHPNFLLSFAYASGPAYGLLLDQVEPDWRGKLDKKSDLGRLLRKVYDVRLPNGLESEAMARLDRYEGQAVLDEEKKRQEPFLVQQAEFDARFKDGPTMILPLESYPSYTYDPNGVKAYGKRGTVYLTTRIVAEWGILEVTSGGALFVKRGDDIVRIVVPAPVENTESKAIVGEGYSLDLEEDWSLKRIGSSGNVIARRN